MCVLGVLYMDYIFNFYKPSLNSTKEGIWMRDMWLT